MRLLRVIGCLLIAATCWSAAPDWGPAQFLVGNWSGEGSGQPGTGSGAFSFTADLQGKVLVRRSTTQFPAADGKPASRHDDLMMVYHDEPGAALHAIYFDSEDHVIRYLGKAIPGGVVFESDGKPGEVRYRLTYTSTGKDAIRIQFEVAPPGKDYARYLDGVAHRQ